MSGIILLSIIAVWFYVVKRVSMLCVRNMHEGYGKKIFYIAVFFLLFIAPVSDEVVGGFQFWYLCKTKAIPTFEKEIAYGKKVYLKSSEAEEISKTILPTSMQNWVYSDSNSKEVIISYIDLYSKGGWFSRWVNFNNSSKPYIFSGFCSGDENGYLFLNLNIHKLEAKNINMEYEK
jgi:hypothetical protein